MDVYNRRVDEQEGKYDTDQFNSITFQAVKKELFRHQTQTADNSDE